MCDLFVNIRCFRVFLFKISFRIYFILSVFIIEDDDK